jgi:hypothetical protein
MHVQCLLKPLLRLNECLHVLTFVFSSLCFTLPTHKSVTDIYYGPSVDAWDRTSLNPCKQGRFGEKGDICPTLVHTVSM